jgi:hypothetical protein
MREAGDRAEILLRLRETDLPELLGRLRFLHFAPGRPPAVRAGRPLGRARDERLRCRRWLERRSEATLALTGDNSGEALE